MKFNVLIVVFLLLLQTGVFAQTKSPYIGYEYEGVLPGKLLPNGVRSNGGGLIGDIDADPVYEIADTQKGKTKMLWLNVSTGKDAKGITGWKVLDVLSFSTLARTRYIFFYGDPAIACTRNGKDIENLVGEGRIVRARGQFIPSNLWVANLKAKRFEPVPAAGVKCQYSEP